MHEFAAARNLIEIACEEAQRAGATRVTSVHVRIGAMRMIDARLIQEAWVVACEATQCQDAELIVETCPARILCDGCGRSVLLNEWIDHCPVCGAAHGRVMGGDELEMTALNVEIESAEEVSV